MTKKQVWRYKCEFCKRSGCSGGHISRHEKSCTANPNRECAMHAYCGGQQKPVAELIALLAAHLKDRNWKLATEELRAATNGCPACMLAAIRQSRLQERELDEEGMSLVDFGFDFKEELALFWNTHSSREDAA